jgi:hypothetical protein
MRLYDGAPDNALKAVMARQEAIKAALKRKSFGVTYFPMEAQWGAYKMSNYQTIAMAPSLEGLYALVKGNHFPVTAKES